MVLRHLSERAASGKDAQTLVKSNLVQSDLLLELLNSPDEETSNGACWIIDQLKLRDPTALEIWRINLWQLALKERLAVKEAGAKKARSDAIDRRIREDRKLFQKEHKILVLGTSESGKSTIVQQMKSVHPGGSDERERAKYRTAIYKNVLDCAGTLARIVQKVEVGSLPEEVWEHAEVLLRVFPAPSGDDAESNTERETESVERGSWITAIDSVDVGADRVPFTDAESDTERETESIESWRTAFESVDEGADQVPFAALTPALVDAVWHIWRTPAVVRVADEQLPEYYLMENAG
jgi:hypothetical protein